LRVNAEAEAISFFRPCGEMRAVRIRAAAKTPAVMIISLSMIGTFRVEQGVRSVIRCYCVKMAQFAPDVDIS